MPRREHLITLGQWTALGVVVGLVCGSASALFLWLLDHATALREAHRWLTFLLPVAGAGMGWFLGRWGQATRAGTSLVIDTIHDDGPELPLRMAPTVLVGTVLTHLFGGSAGREGTAVQVGASLTDWLSHRLGLRGKLRRQLLAAGVAGGFGSVFGTPLAGAVFGLEFVVLGRLQYGALVPALVASYVGDWTTRAWGITHGAYPTVADVPFSLGLAARWLVFAAAVAAVTVAFIELTHWLKRVSERALPSLPWRMALGGLLVVAAWQLVGHDDFLGLGLPTIARAFSEPALPWSTFALKLIFTALTVGFGFLGGEVTPLFFIGAALGNALGAPLGLPLELAAGVGLAAVFAAASNAPLALTVMAVELLGVAIFPHAGLVCVAAYLLTGQRGIYPAQRLSETKLGVALAQRRTLRQRPPLRSGSQNESP